MTDHIIARDPMAQVEARIGIQPIEELLDERNHAVEKVADLRARYGPFGTFDHLRKIELARIAGLLRAQALRDNVKMTEAALTDAGHAHPDYRDLVTTATLQRAEWVKVEAQIEAIDATIQRANAITRYLTSEARL